MCCSFRMKTMRAFLSIAAGAVLCGCGSSEGPAVPVAAAPAPAPAEHQHDAPAPPSAGEAAPEVALLEQTPAYGEGARSNLIGYLAMPQDAAEPLPGIIVIHEWWGLTDDIKAMTRRLASKGYIVLAVDLYGGKTATTPDAANALMSDFYGDPEGARRNLQQAYNYLEKYALAPRIATIGFDLGGGWALQTALEYPGALDAVVMYYGQILTERDRLAPLSVPLLGFFAAEDRSIPVREVQEFRATLSDLGKVSEVLIVPRVDHGFAIPNSAGYNEKAANEAWDTTLAFLERNLKLATPTQAQ
jgi:carboxymethylenebutenolidase